MLEATFISIIRGRGGLVSHNVFQLMKAMVLSTHFINYMACVLLNVKKLLVNNFAGSNLEEQSKICFNVAF